MSSIAVSTRAKTAPFYSLERVVRASTIFVKRGKARDKVKERFAELDQPKSQTAAEEFVRSTVRKLTAAEFVETKEQTFAEVFPVMATFTACETRTATGT